MQNARVIEAQAGINARRNINLRDADDTTLIAESEEELKNLLIDYKKRVGWKGWLKTQHSKS